MIKPIKHTIESQHLPRLGSGAQLRVVCFLPPNELQEIVTQLCPPPGQRWHVETTQSYPELIECLNDRPVQLLLIHLKEVSELQQLKSIQELCPGLVMIVLTHKENMVLGAQALQQGAQDYFCWGHFDAEKLQKSILSAIARQNQIHNPFPLNFHDALTGLEQRNSFLLLLEQAQRKHRHNQNSLYSVVCLELENYEALQYSHGELFCDLLLLELAMRLNQGLCEVDHVARLENGSFALLFEELDDVLDILPLLYRIESLLQRPFCLEDQKFQCSFALGAALSHPPIHSASEILDYALQAMVSARGKNEFQIYHAQGGEPLFSEGLACKHQTLDRQYTPIIHLSENAVIGFEVNLDWHGHQRLSLAEIFLNASDALEYEQALKRIAIQIQRCVTRLPQGSTPLQWFFKLSPLQLRSMFYFRQFQQFLEDLCQVTGLETERFVLMISENLLLKYQGREQFEILNELQMDGFGLVLDEFTGGIASLQAAGCLNFLWARIDFKQLQSLLKDSLQIPVFEVIHPLLSLCNNLKLNPILSQIERQGELNLLPALRTIHAQGTLFGGALPGTELEGIFESV